MKLRGFVVGFVLVAAVLFVCAFGGAAEADEPADGGSAVSKAVDSAGWEAMAEGLRREASLQLPAGVIDTSAPSIAFSEATFSGLCIDEGFESGMGVWASEGSPTWGRTSYRASSGSYSAYCVGSSVAAPGPYPNNVDAWMVAGPFDLSDSIDAALLYDYFLQTEYYCDYFCVMHSGDGEHFSGYEYSGDSSVWSRDTLSLLGRCGDPSVWVAFIFQSDGSYTFPGVYVDNATIISLDRHEEDTSELGYIRGWSTLTNSKASGGSSYECSSGGSNVSVKFTGDYLAWIARTSPGQGRARVTLDYGEPVTVDLYSATPAWQEPVWETPIDLDWGTHKVFIEYTGTKNPSAIGWGINVDAFDVVGTLSEAPLRYQHNRGDIRYSGPPGTWVTNWNNYASYLSFKRSDTTDSTFKVKFTGDHITWVGLKAPAYGRASITLDGVYKGTVSLYAPTQQWEQKIWAGSTTYGQHTLVVTCKGTKESASSGYYIDADAFDIQGVLGWE